MDKQRTNKYLYIVIAVICGVCSLLSLLFFNIFMYAGVGKLDPEDIPALLEKGDRRLTGPTMPPQGLYLNRIWYDKPVGDLFPESD